MSDDEATGDMTADHDSNDFDRAPGWYDDETNPALRRHWNGWKWDALEVKNPPKPLVSAIPEFCQILDIFSIYREPRTLLDRPRGIGERDRPRGRITLPRHAPTSTRRDRCIDREHDSLPG